MQENIPGSEMYIDLTEDLSSDFFKPLDTFTSISENNEDSTFNLANYQTVIEKEGIDLFDSAISSNYFLATLETSSEAHKLFTEGTNKDG